MKLTLVHVASRRSAKSPEADRLAAGYIARAGHYLPVALQRMESEAALLAGLGQAPGRTRVYAMLLDPRGTMLSSEAFAALLGRLRDGGTQQVVLAVGPADGWSAVARGRADSLLSLGPMTLPHELARVVLAEQVYRALTILAGHPYHGGH